MEDLACLSKTGTMERRGEVDAYQCAGQGGNISARRVDTKISTQVKVNTIKPLKSNFGEICNSYSLLIILK